MSRPGLKFAVWVALASALVLAYAVALALALWHGMDAGDRAMVWAVLEDRLSLFVVAAFFLPFVLAAALRPLYAAYPQAALRLGEALRIVRSVNPAHRAAPAGATELRQLAHAVNELADAHRALSSDVQAQVDESNARLARQKNRFAALLSELAQGVLVCNADGRILLYNARAAQLAGGDIASVGLGRSVFGVLDKSAVVHALDRLRQRTAQAGGDAVVPFVTARDGRLLRAQMALVQGPEAGGASTAEGFVLLLEDVTRSIEQASARDAALNEITEGSRASLAAIRAAAETMQQHPGMEAAQRERFVGVVREEAERLSTRLAQALARGEARTAWLLEDMHAADLVAALQRNFELGPGVMVHARVEPQPLWLTLDSHTLVLALTQVAARLHERLGVRALAIEAVPAGERFVRLVLRWSGAALDAAELHAWEAQPVSVGGGQVTTLAEVVERHGGELWAAGSGGDHRLVVQLPRASAEPAPAVPVAVPGRPVYYDFDLFAEREQPELDERTLASLVYTVFDTETTGLEPSGGDEIVSIGAVRIVNGRLLESECYEQLVDPRRPMRREAQQVHGIGDDMLAGQPTIEQVLPAFHRFAEDTVLVAHNAAFDMRFLQLKEAATGVAFRQPVLDTLLLSALAQPGHADADHRLEEIAARLGVPVVGRHTALGDAIVTGEVLLRLIPLLAARGIHTLRQAREASQKTVYAKLDY